MSSEIMLDRLLTIDELHKLYLSLGVSSRTDIDIENTPYDLVAARNSISLLKSVDMIGVRFGRYIKKDKSSYNKILDFKSELKIRIYKYYDSKIKMMFSGVIYYDEINSQYYLKRNGVDLSLSGLLMLLDGLDAVNAKRTDIYINDISLINSYKNPMQHNRQMSIVQLKENLIIKDTLGLEAEKLALKFEMDLLAKQKMNKEPSIISDVDVNAGYDIVSYLNSESLVPNKFIEVKSCADHKYRFFMSKNELETARDKGDSYFLYLYNRVEKKFKIIKNPYEEVFENHLWAKEPQIFQIHQID